MALGMSKYMKQKILNTFLRPVTIWPWPGPFFSDDGATNQWAQPNDSRRFNAKDIEDYYDWPILSLPPESEDRVFQPKLVYVMLFGEDPGDDWTYDKAYVENTKPHILAQTQASHVRSGNNNSRLFIGNNSFGIWGEYFDLEHYNVTRSKHKPTKTTKLIDVTQTPSWMTPDDPAFFYDPQAPIYSDKLFTEIYASNMVDLKFTDCPAATVTHVGIFDALSGGNMLYYGPLDSPVTTHFGQTFVIPARSIRVYCQKDDVNYDFDTGDKALGMQSVQWYTDHNPDWEDLKNGDIAPGFDPTVWYLSGVSDGMSWEFQRRLLSVTLSGGAEMNTSDQGMGTGLFPWSLGFHAGVYPNQQPGWVFTEGDKEIFTDISGASIIDHTAVLNVEVRVPIINYEQMPLWYVPSRTEFNPGGIVKNLTICTWVDVERGQVPGNSYGMRPMPIFQVNLNTPKRLAYGDWLHIKPGDLTIRLK